MTQVSVLDEDVKESAEKTASELFSENVLCYPSRGQ